MPPVTYQINGGTAVFGVMWKYFQTSYNEYPTVDTVMWTLYDNSDWTQNINFTSNNNSYDAIRVVGSTTNADTRKMYYISNGVETLVYHNTVWTDIAYKTITFSAQNVREKIYALLTWSVITNSSGEQVSQSNVGYLLQSGQYKIKENFTVPSDGNMIIQEFESNSQSWGGLYISDVNNIRYKHNPENDNYAFVKVLENGVWVDENYKYITISENTYGDYQAYNDFNTVYDLSTPTTLTFKHFYDAGTIGTGSIKFRHYSQQEPSSGETWVLNESDITTLARTTINFISNNTSFSSIYCQEGKVNELYYQIVGGDDIVAYTGSWSNTAYRTITFATSPTGDLLTWLQANGTKQGGGGIT